MSQFAAMVAPAWLDELRFAPGPPWHAMGTRALDEATWPAPDPADLARKAELLRERHDVVVAALPVSEQAATEAAALVGAADV